MLCEAQLGTAERALLAEVRVFLAAELSPALVASEDAQRTAVADFARGTEWIGRLRPRRWHAAHWPAAHGGAGLTPLENYLLLHQQGYHGAPLMPPMGLNYVGPTVIRFGTPAQQAAVLPGILDGSDYWCQGFSEPGAGSDLAAVATTAVRRGDRYVVNGSKIWTTDAHHANRIFVLLRTGAPGARDALSFVLVDMQAPGVSVRPIRMLSGDHEFNQVFFDEVEIAADQVIGGEGGGWVVTRYLLELERGAFVFAGRLRRRFEQVVARARASAGLEPGFWDAARRLDADLLAYEWTELRLGPAAPRPTASFAPASVIKIAWTELLQRIDALALRLAGADPVAAFRAARAEQPGAAVLPPWLASYYNNRAASIYGGSNEIQRNLVWRALHGAWR